MLKLKLKPTILHQEHLSKLNIALGINNLSSQQPSWTPS